CDMLSVLFVRMLDDLRDGNGPVEDYLVGLERLEAVIDRVDVLIPGHGSVARGDEVRTRVDLDHSYVQTLRHGGVFHDPRVGPDVEPGWEWVIDIHEGQLQRLARRRTD